MIRRLPPAAHFNLPGGMLWSSTNNILLISDTGNDTLRQMFLTNVNGTPLTACRPSREFRERRALSMARRQSPNSMVWPGWRWMATDFGFFIVDAGNNALRVFQPAAPQPPVPAPVLGYVTFIPNGQGGLSSLFNAVLRRDLQ